MCCLCAALKRREQLAVALGAGRDDERKSGKGTDKGGHREESEKESGGKAGDGNNDHCSISATPYVLPLLLLAEDFAAVSQALRG